MAEILFVQPSIDRLNATFSALCSKAVVNFTFLPSRESDFLNYFPDDLAIEIGGNFNRRKFRYVPSASSELDIAIIPAHGSDLTPSLLDFRVASPRTLIAVWLWDNHLAHLNNLKTVLSSDLIFYSHSYCAHYLANPISAIACHLPACSAQWSESQSQSLLDRALTAKRSDKLLINYVDYEFSWRSQILKKIKSESQDIAEVLLMSPDNRDRYFKKTPLERFMEWISYKATLLLPVECDLSTRFFDALFSGLIVLAPENIPDLDRCIPRDVQRSAGVIRIPNLEAETLRHFVRCALEDFDQAGQEGIRRRHEFVRQNHMISNRVGAVIGVIEMLMSDRALCSFVASSPTPPGLYVQPASMRQPV